MREASESDISEILSLYQSGMKMRHIASFMRDKGVRVFDHNVSKMVKTVGQCSVNKMGPEAEEVVKEVQAKKGLSQARIKSLLLSYTRSEILAGSLDEKGDFVPANLIVYSP